LSQPPREEIVRLAEVRRTFRDGGRLVHALDGVDLRLDAGTFACVRGESGAGKSSLLAVVGGMDRGFTGAAVVCGTDLAAASEEELDRFRNENVGFVFQEFHLLPHLSVLENLTVPLVLRGEAGSVALERAHELAGRLGLEPLLGSPARVLSSGEKQRASLGRALSGRPRLLLADEPTASLDARHAGEVLDILEREVSEAGRTLLAVTHDPRLTERAAAVYEMSSGRLEPRG
jgi:putative ABC transport system ATP-binding protein